MATLDAKTRASLPDGSFAYIDSKGKRRLPIHDESHVRNALSRFNQVKFESDAARQRAFEKVLRAAVSHGIAPVGFVANQVERARTKTRDDLPEGQVTLMLTDVEGSTLLVDRLGDSYVELLDELNDLIREAVTNEGGWEVDTRADEFFAVFSGAGDGLAAAVAVQRKIGDREWVAPVRIRIGLHSGRPARTDTNYAGMPVHTAARVCSVGHGGQIVVSSATRTEIGERLPDGVEIDSLGAHHLHGLPEPIELYQAHAPGLDAAFPPLRIGLSG